MATVTLTNATFYKRGEAGVSAVVGYESNSNRVVRYTMLAPTTGTTSVTLEFTGCTLGDGIAPALNFYIGTEPDSHTNAGEGSAYTGELTRSGTTYTGSADIVLNPSETYYVWVFPKYSDSVYHYGWMYWSKTSGAATATTSGAVASTLSASNGTLGEKQTLSITRHSIAFTHTITYKCGTASGTVVSGATKASVDWTPPLELAQQNTTGTTVTVTLTLTTLSGGKSVGTSSKTITLNVPASVIPTVSLTVSDAEGHASKYGGKYVKGLSKLKVSAKATTAQESPISSYKITANGSTYTNAEAMTGVLKSSGNVVVTATVTDLRGRTSAKTTETITVLDYAAPSISKLGVKRCNEEGTENLQGGKYIQVTISAKVSALDNENTATYTLEYKKSSATAYTKVQLSALSGKYTVTNHTHIFAADDGSSYDVRLTVSDNHKTTTKATSASTAFALMHFRADETGIGLGKLSEKPNTVDVGIDLAMNGKRLCELPDPTEPTDAANKKYVDDATAAAITMDLVWENASKTSSFPAQTLALGLQNYDAYMVIARHSTGVGGSVCGINKTGYSIRLTSVGSDPAGYDENIRTATYSGGSLDIGDARHNGAVSNGVVIPIFIYGIKGVV